VAKGKACAKETGTDSVNREFEEVGDFEVTELLEFAQQQDFSICLVEARKSLAQPEDFIVVFVCRFCAVDIRTRTKKKSAKGQLATVGSENLECNGEEIRAKEGKRLIACGSTKKRHKHFLGEFFGPRKIRSAATKKRKNSLT